jgi:hypothetical protein
VGVAFVGGVEIAEVSGVEIAGEAGAIAAAGISPVNGAGGFAGVRGSVGSCLPTAAGWWTLRG